MNRLWIGIGIMVLLLALGIAMLWGSTVFFKKLSNDLEQAGDFALAGNWSAAGEKLSKSQAQWARWQCFWSACTDHEPIEQMQNLFSQLEVYQARQLEVDFATVCRSLVEIAKAIDESHSLKWWGLL